MGRGARHRAPVPYRKLYVGEVATFYAIATQLKIAAYFNLGHSLPLAHLAGPAADPDPARRDATWDNATATKGKLDDVQARPPRAAGTRSPSSATPRPVHRAQQLGHGWGDGGYAYASNAYAAKAFTEAYGVASVAHWQTAGKVIA